MRSYSRQCDIVWSYIVYLLTTLFGGGGGGGGGGQSHGCLLECTCSCQMCGSSVAVLCVRGRVGIVCACSQVVTPLTI